MKNKSPSEAPAPSGPVATAGSAQAPVAQTGPVEEWKWTYRPLIIHAGAPGADSEALVQEQLNILENARSGLKDRDMIVVILREQEGESLVEDDPISPRTAQNLTQRFFPEPPGQEPPAFRVVLVGKDGTVKLRREKPVTTEEIFGLIDSMPMRRREMSEDDGE